MLREFTVDTQRFVVKTCFDRPCADEAKVKFENRKQAQAFLDHAMKFGSNSIFIKRIAKDVATSFCPTKNAPKRTDNELLQNMISDIDSGKLSVVLKNSVLKKVGTAPIVSEKEVPIDFYFLQSFIPMEKFLSDYRQGFSPPEHDIHRPIKL